MNTCKAALRILKARKLYVIIYLVLIGTMMFSISWQIMRGSTAARATTYEPESARIAVIDRDDDAEHVAQSLRSYLALDGEMVTIDDDSISLQQAVASNYVDLIAIVPTGFAERYLQYADNATATQPTIDTVVSYASGAGSLAQLKVNEFLFADAYRLSRHAAGTAHARRRHGNDVGCCHRRYETVAYRRGVLGL